jgi:hypothetical protein
MPSADGSGEPVGAPPDPPTNLSWTLCAASELSIPPYGGLIYGNHMLRDNINIILANYYISERS